MKKTITLTDERGMFQFSKMILDSGKDISLEQLGEGFSGMPEVVDIWVLLPNAIYDNPAKPIDPEKEYRIIIIEKEEKEK